MPRPVTRRTAALALALAVAVDLVQLALIPLFAEGALSPANDILDVAAALVLSALLGWHAAFLPSFLGELIPFVNLVPTWTAAVLWVTRERRETGEGGRGTGSTDGHPPREVRVVENLAGREEGAREKGEWGMGDGKD